MSDQFTFTNPITQYPAPEFDQGSLPGAGLAKDMTPKPDHGEETYRGTGRLEGRRAIVTGADSGIGRAATIAIAREGADVVLSYLPEEEADAREVVELVEKAGRKAVAVPGDVTDEAYATTLVERALSDLGGLDLVISVAGKQQTSDDITALTTPQLVETYETNVFGLVWLVKAAVPHLPPGSSIITTTSVQAYQPSPTLVDYAGTKAAINAITKALAGQLAEKGIRVNSVAPGPVWTPLQPAGGQPESALPEFGAQTPYGRPGQPAEYGGAYVYLASQESSYTSGSTLSITGGMPTP